MMTPKDSEIVVTSHDPRYEFEGCTRYEPIDNVIEVDRFTEELIENNMCFLYGDTYYTTESMRIIVNTEAKDTIFFGNKKAIVAVKIADSSEFRKHKSLVKKNFLEGKIEKCKGWQVYQSFTGQDMKMLPRIKEKFVIIDSETIDINTPEDYHNMI